MTFILFKKGKKKYITVISIEVLYWFVTMQMFAAYAIEGEMRALSYQSYLTWILFLTRDYAQVQVL